MKKVKIMLSAIAVMAIVGGALAFTAKSAVCLYTKAADGSCPFEKRILQTVSGSNVVDATTALPGAQGCPATDPADCTSTFNTIGD